MAQVNFTNHIATNLVHRTKRFIRLELGQTAYFTQMPAARVTSWVSLLYRAASEDSNISQLVPIYTRLVQPPDDVLDFLDYLVVTMQVLMGPLPVTDQALKWNPESYLSCMHLVLTNFQAAQDTPYAPKLFTLMSQTGHHTHFVKISTTSLQKFLKAAGEDVPPLTEKRAKEEFNDKPDCWWSRFASCLSFSRRPPIPPPPERRRTFHTFHHEVLTDGVNVGVLMFQPHPAPSPPAEAQASPPPNGKKRKRQRTSTEWVLAWQKHWPAIALLAWNLGKNRCSLLLSTASQQQTACRSSTPLTAPLTTTTPPCHGPAAGGRKPGFSYILGFRVLAAAAAARATQARPLCLCADA